MSKRYTILERIDYFSNRLKYNNLTRFEKRYAEKQLKFYLNYIQTGKVLEMRSKEIVNMDDSKKVYHPVIINKKEPDGSYYVNVVSNSPFKYNYRAKSLGSNSNVNLFAYKRTKENKKIVNKKLFETTLYNKLSVDDFNYIKNNTIYK